MKKVVLLLVCLLLLSGCAPFYYYNTKKNVKLDKKEEKESIKLEIGKYEDIYNNSLNRITLTSDGNVYGEYCVENSECAQYSGTYTIDNDKLYITFTKYYDYVEWADIPSGVDASSYIIKDSKTFENYNHKYILED